MLSVNWWVLIIISVSICGTKLNNKGANQYWGLFGNGNEVFCFSSLFLFKNRDMKLKAENAFWTVFSKIFHQSGLFLENVKILYIPVLKMQVFSQNRSQKWIFSTFSMVRIKKCFEIRFVPILSKQNFIWFSQL